MTKKQVENKDILNAIRNESSLEYQDKVPVATGANDSEVMRTLDSYPSLRNEFINTLTNRVVETKFFQKIFNNPLRMLHKGMLPFGKTVEQLFVEKAEKKGFNEHFSGSTSNEADLIGVVKPKVVPKYITQNYAYKFKTSISQAQLRGAFTNPKGLGELVNAIVASLSSSVYYEEYKDMKKILTNPTVDALGGSTIGKGVIDRIFEDEELKETAIIYTGASSKDLLKGIKLYTDKLVFPSDKFNLSKVETFTNKEDMMLFITPEAKVNVDLDVLATTFNISKAEIEPRLVVLDSLGTVNGKTVQAILCDSDLVQAYDTVNETNSFYNGDKLATNLFAHKHGIMAQCDFANSIVFVEGEKN